MNPNQTNANLFGLSHADLSALMASSGLNLNQLPGGNSLNMGNNQGMDSGQGNMGMGNMMPNHNMNAMGNGAKATSTTGFGPPLDLNMLHGMGMGMNLGQQGIQGMIQNQANQNQSNLGSHGLGLGISMGQGQTANVSLILSLSTVQFHVLTL